jgi:uncharacterized protein
MALSLYDFTVPVLQRSLKALDAVLTKAEADAEARKIDPAVFLQSRLAPDMFPLLKQVQLASDFAKGTAARLAGVEPPSFPDDEQTFADLHARIAKTLDVLDGLDRAAFDGAETREVSMKVRGETRTFQPLVFLTQVGLPNFFFHAATAYDILRHNGVALGKRDFIG